MTRLFYFVLAIVLIGLSLFIAIHFNNEPKNIIPNVDKFEGYPGLISLIMVKRETDFSVAEINKLPEWFLLLLAQTKIDSVYADQFYNTKITVPERIKKRLKIRFVDLNQDEFPEVILNYTGLNECGNKTCPSEIYTIDIQNKKLNQIGSITEFAYYILNAQDKNFEYAETTYVNQFKVIVDCTYDQSELALLVYSIEQHRYQRLALANQDELNSKYHFNDRCKFVTHKDLMISGEEIRNALKKYKAIN